MLNFFLGVLTLTVIALIYFIPTIVAYRKSHRNTGVIFVINLFLGRTVICWILALCLALWKKE